MKVGINRHQSSMSSYHGYPYDHVIISTWNYNVYAQNANYTLTLMISKRIISLPTDKNAWPSNEPVSRILPWHFDLEVTWPIVTWPRIKDPLSNLRTPGANQIKLSAGLLAICCADLFDWRSLAEASQVSPVKHCPRPWPFNYIFSKWKQTLAK